jgi:hypothetical protein
VRYGELGVRKSFAYGLNAAIGASVDQRSGSSPTFSQNRATTTTAVARLTLDLWKDLLGRTTHSNLQSAELGSQRAKIQREIGRKATNLTLRRTYWAIVGNELSTKITTELLGHAEKQSSESRKRQANFVADEGEVARYEGQAASRRSSLMALKYQRDKLERVLKEMIPSLAGQQIVLNPVDVEGPIQQVLACTATIASQSTTPLEFTPIDELISLLRQEKGLRLKVAATTSDIDLKLNAQARVTGVDRGTPQRGSPSGAINDINDNDRKGHSISLDLVVPLGGARSDQEDVKKMLEEKRFDAEIGSLEARLQSTHEQIKNSIPLIMQVLKNQRENAGWLRKRTASEQRKFAQARVSVVNLINDQDALLSSELDVISSQLNVMNLLLDYLAIFTDTPCDFNTKAHL